MSNEPITIRLAQATDLPALHSREPDPGARVAQKHFERQAAGDYFYAVAWRGERPLGTCVLDTERGRELCPELRNLWVYPDARRQGVARALTTFLEGQASELGFDEVFLRVDPNNEAAIPMYIGLDYTPTGNHAPANYESVDPGSPARAADQLDAVYRKSLRIR